MPTDLTQAEIIDQATELIINHMDETHDIHRPRPEILAILHVLDLAERMAGSPAGWGPASAIVLKVAEGFGITFPAPLALPLTGRIR